MKNFLNVYNPYDNKVISRLKCDNLESINQKLNKLKKHNWSNDKKQKFFKKVKENLNYQKIDLAKLIVSEVGVSFKDAIYEVERSILCTEICFKIINKIDKNFHSKFLIKKKNDPKIKIIEEPFNSLFAITPFNLPLVLSIHKIFPAVIADVPVVFKPSEKTPLSSIKMIKILIDCGLDKNFIKLIITNNPKKISKYIIENFDVDCLSFTGSSKIGMQLNKYLVNSKNSLKKYVPELGGCSSLIICEDADLKKAVNLAIDGCLKYSGQRCTSVRRIIVDNKIANNFLNKLKKEVEKINFGNPANKSNIIGTLIDKKALKIVKKRIDRSINSGSKLIYGNFIKDNCLSPTILDNVKINMDIVSKETFGPICAIIRSKNINHAIKLANNTKYQMACGVVTKKEKFISKITNQIKVGQISVNGAPGYRNESAPFGGFGESGNGEKEGIYLATKSLKNIRVVYKH
tara:strand:+ start:148 stop:1530 length:1383 start_codon:yes stop_codon:yes gene_type:complete